MKYAKRSELVPGQMFINPFGYWMERASGSKQLLVVLDAKHETDFYRGGLWCVGDVGSALEVEVV